MSKKKHKRKKSPGQLLFEGLCGHVNHEHLHEALTLYKNGLISKDQFNDLSYRPFRDSMEEAAKYVIREHANQ